MTRDPRDEHNLYGPVICDVCGSVCVICDKCLEEEMKEVAPIRKDHEQVELLVGAWVNYDQLPYQMATPEYDRLLTGHVATKDEHEGTRVYQLDRQAVIDLIAEQHRSR